MLAILSVIGELRIAALFFHLAHLLVLWSVSTLLETSNGVPFLHLSSGNAALSLFPDYLTDSQGFRHEYILHPKIRVVNRKYESK